MACAAFSIFSRRKKYKLHVRVFLAEYRGYATLPGLRGRATAAGSARSARRRQDICRSFRADDQRSAAISSTRSRSRLNKQPSRTTFWTKFASACTFSTKLASTTSRSIVWPPLFQAAKRSASSSRRRSARVSSARSTCWTSPPSACTRATRTGSFDILEDLRDLGNTILVVEHDPDIMRAADHLLDLGPGAGEFGGKSDLRG